MIPFGFRFFEHMSFQREENRSIRVRHKGRAKAKELVKSVLPERNAPHLAGGISIFIESVIALQILLLLLHFMIFRTLVVAFGVPGLPLAIVLGLLSITFISASILATKFKDTFVRGYYKLAGIWFAFIAPLCGACFLFALTEDIALVTRNFIEPSFLGSICFGVAITITLYGMWNSTRAQITRICVKLPDLPEFWKGKKAVFVSDLQLGDIWGRGFSEKIVKKINEIQPLAIFVGGDLYDGVQCDADRLIAPFKDIQAPLGAYFISGNHEYIRDSELFFEAIRNVGMRILKNEKIDLRGIQLVGVDFNDADKKEPFDAILGRMNIDLKRPSILLKHVPEHLDISEKHGVSFQLSGHTHRGQFFPLGFVTRRIYGGYDYGLKRRGSMWVYTSSGVGTWMSPFRLGTKSEIVEITFE
jgi:predicted MPP superfamily phosphohydrolase